LEKWLVKYRLYNLIVHNIPEAIERRVTIHQYLHNYGRSEWNNKKNRNKIELEW